MINAAWDWYYGSQDEELLADSEFGEPYSTKRCTNKDVCVRPATLNSGLQVTIFTQVKSRPKEVTDLEKSSKRLKLLRHPNILRHIGIVITETEVHLVTERVSPLYIQFETADANEVTTGIYDIAQAQKFLHEKAGLTHNSVSIDSIYVTEGGAWKLSNFENSCLFNEATSEYLKSIKRHEGIIPPEDRDKNMKFPIEKKFAHCRDVYALGVLLGIFNKQTRFASEVRSQELEDLLQEILQKDYKSRPMVSEVLETAILSSEYIEIVNFLQSVTLKSEFDKKRFFNELLTRLQKACISEELIAKRIAKLLLSPVVLSETDAVEKVIPHLLTPIPIRRQVKSSGLVSSSNFARYIIPQIVDLMEIKILHVRLVLVNNFHRYAHMFDKTVLQDSVLPEILLGLHDSNNQLVKASLHALADAVPIVGGDIIVGTEREKIFGFGMPRFNGSVLVDTTSLAQEIKPKRKPKKPKSRSVPSRPKTLLELAMQREKSPTKKAKTQRQRDLMMLKQNELAATLSPRNSVASHSSEEMPRKVSIESIKTPTPSTGVNGHISPVVENPISPESVPVSKEKSCGSMNIKKSEDIDQGLQRKEITEPEIETWAGSDSEGENWDDFDNFNSKKDIKINETVINTEYLQSDVTKTMNSDNKLTTKHESIQNSTPVDEHTNANGLPDNTSTIPKPQNQNLGDEFEISVKVKPKLTSNELDFFADMVPEIPSRKFPMLPSSQTIPRHAENSGSYAADSVSTKSSPVSAVSFTAPDDLADDEATDGWENDTIAWDE